MAAQKEVDIAQRVAEVLTRTSQPFPSARTRGGDDREGFSIIGTVPVHLQHLHNLLDELADEMIEGRRALAKKEEGVKHVRDLFFTSLESQLEYPKDVEQVVVFENWEVGVKLSD